MESNAGTRARSGPYLNAAVLVALVAILALVALVTQPPTPPSVAEFAPQAVEQITDAPSNQSSQFGSGAGEGTSGSADEAGGGDAPQSIDAARVKRCIGNPARQIEDPQSPPCAPYFSGDNGGSTYQGVTRDEIRVFRAYGSEKVDEVLADFFNKRFEFYGRKIKVVGKHMDVNESAYEPGTLSHDPAAQRAAAVTADQTHRVFASLGMEFRIVLEPSAYYAELAERGIVSASVGGYPYVGEDLYSRLHPYHWSVLPSASEQQRHLAEWVCKTLAGRPASRAGGTLSARTRKFAVAVGTQRGVRADSTPLIDGLRGCGQEPFMMSVDDATPVAENNKREIGRAVEAGVTSILCVCRSGIEGLSRAAREAAYIPEWPYAVGMQHDFENGTTIGGHPMPGEQRMSVFGISAEDKINPLTDQPWYWGFRETAPEGWSRIGGRTPEAQQTGHRDFLRYRYKEFLLLASGIQLAGPRLTPQTFAQGLMKTRFPNPDCGSAPLYQACVGFGAGDNTMVSDASMVWWEDTMSSYDSDPGDQGAWCYADLGKRYKRSTWPREPQPYYDRTRCR